MLPILFIIQTNMKKLASLEMGLIHYALKFGTNKIRIYIALKLLRQGIMK